jgi:hypothetical protein
VGSSGEGCPSASGRKARAFYSRKARAFYSRKARAFYSRKARAFYNRKARAFPPVTGAESFPTDLHLMFRAEAWPDAMLSEGIGGGTWQVQGSLR